MAKRKLILNVVVEGTNIMGEALCEMHGVVTEGKRVVREVTYSGPVTSIDELIDALGDIFKEAETA